MADKWDLAHMNVAEEYSKLSSAKRLKVGAIIVKDGSVLSFGYNGMPSGWTNECETREYCTGGGWLCAEEIKEKFPLEEDGRRYKLVTKPEVLHAEANAISKLAKHGGTGADGASIYTTTEPCINCAKMIYQAGIKKVFWRYEHLRAHRVGIRFLEKAGLEVCKI